jgi:hypothetical protein
MRELKNILYTLLTLQLIQLVIVATQLHQTQEALGEIKDYLLVIESTTGGIMNRIAPFENDV